MNILFIGDIVGKLGRKALAKNLSLIKQKYNKPGEAFIGLVHRLDRPTGGLMVFARNSKSAQRLSNQLQSNLMQKVYYAVVEGNIKLNSQHLVNYLKKDEKNNIVKICRDLICMRIEAEIAQVGCLHGNKEQCNKAH